MSALPTDPNHPVYGLAKFLGVVLVVAVVMGVWMWRNATNFDGTEINAIIGTVLTLLGLKGGQLSLAKLLGHEK